MERIQRLIDERASLWADAQEILEISDSDMTAQDVERLERLTNEVDTLSKRIATLEAANGVAAQLGETRREVDLLPGNTGDLDSRKAEASAEYTKVFDKYIRRGMGRMRYEEIETLEGRREDLPDEVRALYSTNDAAGAYLVPEDFADVIVKARAYYGPMRRVATVIRTADGGRLPIPTNDDTGNKGAILGDDGSTAATEQDTTFGVKNLDAYTYTSKIIRVSRPLLQDSAFDLEAYIGGLFGEHIGRIENEHFTTGTGTDQPNGIVTAATVGYTTPSTQVDSLSYDDLVELEHSVDIAYRDAGTFMLNDNTVKAIRLLKDADDRPLWQPSIQVGQPDTILGKPYAVNNEMADMAAGTTAVIFGDLRAYWIRDVLGIQALRLNERYAEYLHVGFLAFARTDGELVDANAVRALEMAAA